MRKCVQRGLYSALFAGGLIVLGTGAASAAQSPSDDGLLSGIQSSATSQVHQTATHDTAVRKIVAKHLSDDVKSLKDKAESSSDKPASASTSGKRGILSGTQAALKAAVPVKASGNTVSVIGDNKTRNTVGDHGPADDASDGNAKASTSGKRAVASGNQAGAKASAPVDVSGNTVSVIGDNDTENSTDHHERGASATTSGDDSSGSGNQAGAKASAPVEVSGNTVSVIGDNKTRNTVKDQKHDAGATGKSPKASTSGKHGAASGNQVGAKKSVPVRASGNTISLIGNNDTKNEVTRSDRHDAASAESGAAKSSGDHGLAAGNQVGLEETYPVDVSGNTISLVGNNTTENMVGRDDREGAGADRGVPVKTSGDAGLGSGNQGGVRGTVPVNADGNTVSVFGDNDARNTVVRDGRDGPGSDRGAVSTSGDDGLIGGNQVGAEASVPVSAEGNTFSVFGDNKSRNTVERDGSSVSGPARGGNASTSGDDGVGNGNQVGVQKSVPVHASGNTASVFGDNDTKNTVVREGHGAPVSTSGDRGVVGGNQVGLEETYSVDAEGNTFSVFGDNAAENTVVKGAGSVAGADQGVPVKTSGDAGLGSGNQGGVRGTVPVNADGNTVSVFGDNDAKNTVVRDGRDGSGSDRGAVSTSGDDGLLGGNQIGAEASVPVSADGNTFSVFGDNKSRNTVTSTVGDHVVSAPRVPVSTTGGRGVVGGNQVGLQEIFPVNVSGNSFSVFGDNVAQNTVARGDGDSNGANHGSPVSTPGDDGIGSGNQAGALKAVPVSISGNSFSVFGDNAAQNTVTRGGRDSILPAMPVPGTTSGDTGVISGNQAGAGFLVPISVDGNTFSVFGDNASTNTVVGGGATDVGYLPESSPSDSGDRGIASGTQALPWFFAPIAVEGNNVSVLGDNTVTAPKVDGTDG
ncbi:beta strand repeat-containing protein, partial [Arthrobacter rhombi]